MAAYFRQFNFQTGFTFDDLDDMIRSFVNDIPRPMTGQNHESELSFYSELMAKILLKVIISAHLSISQS